MKMDALCTEFFNTLPAGIKADPKKVAKKLREHFVTRTCYYGRRKTYYFEASPKNYIPLDRPTLVEELILRGLLYKPKAAAKPLKNAPKSQLKKKTDAQEKAAAQAKIARCLSEVRERRQIGWVGELSGHFPGLVKIDRESCLILKGPETD